jgi:hypothetical protein
MDTARILAAVTLIALVTAIIVVIVDPAFAELRPTSSARPAPGPIAGAGLITVVIGACAYWLLRRLRKLS